MLSSDRFLDILANPVYSDFHHVIRSRRVDVLFLGSEGTQWRSPQLAVRDAAAASPSLLRRLYALPVDREYHTVREEEGKKREEKVVEKRREWSFERKERLLAQLDAMLVTLDEREGRLSPSPPLPLPPPPSSSSPAVARPLEVAKEREE